MQLAALSCNKWQLDAVGVAIGMRKSSKGGAEMQDAFSITPAKLNAIILHVERTDELITIPIFMTSQLCSGTTQRTGERLRQSNRKRAQASQPTEPTAAAMAAAQL